MTPSPVTVFGGAGFVGRYIVKQLVGNGAAVRVAGRHPERGLFLKTMAEVGQISLVHANLLDEASVVEATKGAESVVNSVGILFERGRQCFEDIHIEGAKRIAAAAKANGAGRLIHISAIGADKESSAQYARSKAAGEVATREIFPGATVLRPSVVFGPEDDFFNRFAKMARVFPVIPLLEGETKFQPIYVSDVAKAVVAALNRPGSSGETYELGGPEVYRFREIMELVFTQTGRNPTLLSLPSSLFAPLAAIFECFPNPPVTRDQLRLMQHDNVVGKDAKTLLDLGIPMTPPEVVLPTYLKRFKRGGGHEVDRHLG